MGVMRPEFSVKNSHGKSSSHASADSFDEGLVHGGFDRVPDYWSDTSSDSIDNLNCDRLSLNTKYVKYERYFKQLITLGREVLGRDHTYDRAGMHFFNTDRYLHLRDKIYSWITHPDNATLFTDPDTNFYLAQMEVTMRTIEITLSLSHQPISWPGAVPSSQQLPIWPGVQKGEVYCHFDQLIYGGKELATEAMPWNRKKGI